jgi:hypothetical protein
VVTAQQLIANSNTTHLATTAITTFIKENPNSWFQEIRKLLGHNDIWESARKSPGNYLNSAGNFVCLCLRFSGEPQEGNKSPIFSLSDFFSENLRKESRLCSICGKTSCDFQEFTRKLPESHPELGSGNHMKGAGNSGLP